MENENTPAPPVVHELLPDLEVLPQRFATFDPPPPFFDDVAVPGTSCFHSEVEEQGISRGWADEYWWALPDQMIEVSSLPDGTYALVTHVDPADKIRELAEANNCVRIPITLTGLGTNTPSATLGTTPTSCA